MGAEKGPLLVVAAAIVKGGKVLLARRVQPELPEAHMKWELPGGKVKFEEGPHEALIREIKEELDADIRIVRLLPHVQNNIYHGLDRTVHSVVLAFESVIVRGTKLPSPTEEAIGEVRWVEKDNLSKYDLLPGTKQFVECLYKTDKASYSSENIYIKLERRSTKGTLTDYCEIRSIYDLWNNFNILERHANLINHSIRQTVKEGIEKNEMVAELLRRVRLLVSRGYYIADSDDLRFCSI